MAEQATRGSSTINYKDGGMRDNKEYQTRLRQTLEAGEVELLSPEMLISSRDAEHPANLIPSLCEAFYKLGWVTGTGGGISIRKGALAYFAPSGVQKERIKPEDLFVLDLRLGTYLRYPLPLKPSQCTPLFHLSFMKRGAGACIHTHSQWAVLVTLLVEQELQQRTAKGGFATWDDRSMGGITDLTGAERSLSKKRWDATPGRDAVLHRPFRISRLEQIKGIPAGQKHTDGYIDDVDLSKIEPSRPGYLSYYDTLAIPIIENTAHEEDLSASLAAAIEMYPHSSAVLVKRHGVYVWGETWVKAKTVCESLDYIFQLAIEMRKLNAPWTED
ncbi:Methylthioribulose-1-phosphate dehydratase [Eremomyces bilateralis CBS 781.70]|uniref:Methylthioribulose-1-phosphate dehydratase n=1 Tax=Eremomyces bilateralis CBS 781.70 TaxID=1392243 RepID=A0A6G1G2V8_9PEZI|nr:Methylthioribulose-1-phosphate dehydratase [Eremomyces bilateralis CBS 781.70]KAF1812447.1 Methylthioribulose-1-phosphate dehydratase [Eremomyces bilateralis CBS 781.70]